MLWLKKINCKSLLDENNDKLSQLEDRLGQAEEQEREKDAEIISLQKEMKFMIQRKKNGKRDCASTIFFKNFFIDFFAIVSKLKC